MTGATCNIYAGLHEPFDVMVPIHFLRPGDLFLDIGANIGCFTVLASGVCKAKTFAFEPDPDTACHLRKNIDVNNLSDLVTVYQCALGADTEEIAFTVGQDSVNRIATSSDKHTRTVRIEKLDSVVAGYQPAMMKIDVEGAKTDVLSGAKHLLANPCLKVIEIETVNAESENILTGNGFERAIYNPFRRLLSRTSLGNQSSNSLFVRDWTFVEARLRSAEAITVLGRTI
jgi:FkbM family methyltransferase